MKGAIIAYNPCKNCKNAKMCQMCELTYYRDILKVQFKNTEEGANHG